VYEVTTDTFVFIFSHVFLSGKMAVARQGGWATNGAAEGMKMETQELDELMRGADGVKGDVRDALCEAVGVRPTLCAQWVHCALKGAKP
jgi:hypothetical protein